jgi:hypothetical protein
MKKKVQPISTSVVSTPEPLNDNESIMLRHLVRLRDQANSNLSDYISYVLAVRGLKATDEAGKPTWAVTLNDYKTFVPADK